MRSCRNWRNHIPVHTPWMHPIHSYGPTRVFANKIQRFESFILDEGQKKVEEALETRKIILIRA